MPMSQEPTAQEFEHLIQKRKLWSCLAAMLVGALVMGLVDEPLAQTVVRCAVGALLCLAGWACRDATLPNH